MKRIGIYGGTFNPPHVGHLCAAKYALSALELDKLLVIPSNMSPGKTGGETPDAVLRLRMTEIAMANEPDVQVLDMELQRGGVSYTVETVETVHRMYPQDALVLLVGVDMFLTLHNWYRLEDILKQASIAVLGRGRRKEAAALEAQKKALEALGAKVYMLDNPVTEISSTDVRRMLTFRCADEFLLPAVADYIREMCLYGTDRDLRGLPEKELERVVVSLLKPNRVNHVLGCRDTAVKMARVWGVNETDAARAALLHDITKALDGPLQLTLCRAYGIVLDDFSTQNPKTLHALTGSLVAQRIFGENEAVVRAIASHTTGKGNMNALEEIIYVADYMEPNRDFPGVEELRRLAYTDLHGAMRTGLNMTLAMLKEQGREISPGSQEALDWLNSL